MPRAENRAGKSGDVREKSRVCSLLPEIEGTRIYPLPTVVVRLRLRQANRASMMVPGDPNIVANSKADPAALATTGVGS